MDKKGQWEAYAQEVRDVRNRLLKVIMNPEYQKLLPKKERNSLNKALDCMDKFRSDAENGMFRDPLLRDTTIWYPVKE